MNFWVGIGVAAVMLLLGLVGLLGGGFLIFQQMKRRREVEAGRARRAVPLPPSATPMASAPRVSKAQPVAIQERPPEARKAAEAPAPPPAPSLPPPPAPGKGPEVLPFSDMLDDDVPTGVFRPAQMGDIETMMREADKYVSSHKKGS